LNSLFLPVFLASSGQTWPLFITENHPFIDTKGLLGYTVVKYSGAFYQNGIRMLQE
jgi:hypothetical protein